MQGTGAENPGVFKWTITRRGPVIANVRRDQSRMQQPEEIVAALSRQFHHHRLRERAMKACRTAVANCAAEDEAAGTGPLSGWPFEDIVFRFDKCSLTFASTLLDYAFFDTQLGLYRSGDSSDAYDTRIGTYRLITDIEGKDVDDYLIIDVHNEDTGHGTG